MLVKSLQSLTAAVWTRYGLVELSREVQIPRPVEALLHPAICFRTRVTYKLPRINQASRLARTGLRLARTNVAGYSRVVLMVHLLPKCYYHHPSTLSWTDTSGVSGFKSILGTFSLSGGGLIAFKRTLSGGEG